MLLHHAVSAAALGKVYCTIVGLGTHVLYCLCGEGVEYDTGVRSCDQVNATTNAGVKPTIRRDPTIASQSQILKS